MTQYFKVTNNDDDINISSEEFNKNSNPIDSVDGFYITRKEYISSLYSDGVWLQFVSLPIDDPEFKMIPIKGTNCWLVNKMILGKRMSLLSMATYIEMEIPLKDEFINYALEKSTGDLDRIERLIRESYDHRTLILSCAHNGYTKVLDWIYRICNN